MTDYVLCRVLMFLFFAIRQIGVRYKLTSDLPQISVIFPCIRHKVASAAPNDTFWTIKIAFLAISAVYVNWHNVPHITAVRFDYNCKYFLENVYMVDQIYADIIRTCFLL